MFCSPLVTREQRKGETNLLAGNIFAAKNMRLPVEIYTSLFHTLAMEPKKKHYKKVIEYIRAHEPVGEVPQHIIDKMISVGIVCRYPVTLGQVVRDLIVRGDYNIHKSTFIEFVKFMERSKGFEEDAKKFYILLSESSHLQIDYEMIRPLVIRLMKRQGGGEVMKFFEQLRKKIVLNKSWATVPTADKQGVLRTIRKDFYDGFITDLMTFDAFALAEIVMSEKLKEKFDLTQADEVIALNVYSAQKKLPEYKEKYEILMDPKGPYKLDEILASELGATLMAFDHESDANERLTLMERIRNKMLDEEVGYTADLFHAVVYVNGEAQQWTEVAALLKQFRGGSTTSVKPEMKTVTYIRQNMIYCFENSVKIELQDSLDAFEQRYFSYH